MKEHTTARNGSMERESLSTDIDTALRIFQNVSAVW